MSKALMEKVALSYGRSLSKGATRIMCARYGNVLCTRGSVIPLWLEQMQAGQPLTLTDPGMSRFIMTLSEAVELVLYALEHGQGGDLFVQKAPACTVGTMARALCSLFGYDKDNIRVIGSRHGEKRDETLLTGEECSAAIDEGRYYRVPCDGRNLNYELSPTGAPCASPEGYCSGNGALLSEEEVLQELASLPYIRAQLEAKRGGRI
jgi:UDP-glucose 4-epimerase